MRRAVRERRTSRAARWSRRVAGFAAILLAISSASHRSGLIETPSFLWVLAIAGALAALALLLAVAGFARIWRYGDRGGFSAVWGLVVGLCVLAPFAVSGIEAWRYPMLNDISTDLTNPPEFLIAQRMRSPDMNEIRPISHKGAEMQVASYPGIGGRRYEFAQQRVLGAVEALMAERGWRMLGKTETASPDQGVVIEAAAKSLLMGFVDDVAVRVLQNDGATFVDMSSASRYGRHDFGGNARLIDSFMADLDDRMEALAGP